MNYTIIEKNSFHILEKVETHTVENGENLKSIPDFWTRSHADGTVKTLLDAASDKTFVFGICYNSASQNEKTFEYSIATVCDRDAVPPKGVRIKTIPARTWAVFECVGAMPDAIQSLWQKICTEFFPTAAYQPTYEMDVEAYSEGDTSDPDYRSEIWIPVTKK